LRDEQRKPDIRNIPIDSVGVTGLPSRAFEGRIHMNSSKEKLTCCNGHFALHDIEGILALGILASLSGDKGKTGNSSTREATER